MMISKKQILGGLGIYFAVRFFSYFFSPSTPLYAANPVNWLMSLAILIAAVYFLIKKDERGWLIVAAEIILGGAGNFLEVKDISLRTILLILSLSIYLFQIIKDKTYKIVYKNNIIIICLISFIMATVMISAIRGYYLNHDIVLVLADAIPYLFFLYYFPFKQLLLSQKFRQISFNMLIVAVIGNFIVTFFTLAGFSSEIFILQDSYYHWFRDIASGKITDYGTGFFRILLNEQLLIAPLLVFFIGKQMLKQVQHDKNHTIATERKVACHPELVSGSIAAILLATLTINLTRIYLVAIAVGLLFLFSKTNWKRWLAYCAGAFIFFVVAFSTAHLAATKGKSFGLEYLGLRFQSIAAPQIENSSLSRLLLLPKILEKIKLHPFLGNGLGDTVTVYSPIFKENITTPHFDWGYLEIIAEMGLFGLAAWLSLIAYCILLVTKNRGLLASVVSLLIINITSPALFHVLGIIFLTYLLAYSVDDATFHQDSGSAI